jgi:hypothetical protein
MKTLKIKDPDFQIKLPKKSAFAIETPEHQFKMHQLSAVVASRGSGKSVIVSSLLQGLKNQGCMDRVFIISPTIASNRPIFDPLGISEEDEYHQPNGESVADVIRKVNEEQDEWEEYEKNLKMYKILQKLLSNQKVRLDDIPQEYLEMALQGGYLDRPPTSKYGHRPVLGLIIDDCQGTPLYVQSAKNPLINLLLRHRHVGRGLGLSVWLMAQSYNSPSGIPRSVRQNLTTLFLGRQKNEDVVKQIAEELGGSINKEGFMKIFNKCHENDNPHDFLVIDFHPKDPSKQFRKNLNEYILSD